MDVFAIIMTGLGAVGVAFILGIGHGGKAVLEEALDRGYAVQCVGKSGIYWECE